MAAWVSRRPPLHQHMGLTRPYVPAYNAAASSSVRIGLQRCGRFIRLFRRVTHLWLILASLRWINSGLTYQTRANRLWSGLHQHAAGSPSTPVYNARRRLPVRAGLQLPRPTLPSAPTYYAVADSSGCAVSEAAAVFVVRLSRPGLHQHTGPHLSA